LMLVASSSGAVRTGGRLFLAPCTPTTVACCIMLPIASPGEISRGRDFGEFDEAVVRICGSYCRKGGFFWFDIPWLPSLQ
jgi:hypothetical protein